VCSSDLPLEQGTLRREDILEVVRYLLELKSGNGQIDDIDHLGNRRVRGVGESLQNQFRVGLVRMERAIIERMSIQQLEVSMPHDLINSKPVTAAMSTRSSNASRPSRRLGRRAISAPT